MVRTIPGKLIMEGMDEKIFLKFFLCNFHKTTSQKIAKIKN